MHEEVGASLRHLTRKFATKIPQLDVHGSAHRDTGTKITNEVHYID